MQLPEKVRMEVYLPDLAANSYKDLLETFETELTYTFGGCTVIRGLEGRYLSNDGAIIPDRINIVYCDLPLNFENDIEALTKYTTNLKQIAFEALKEEAILITLTKIFHAV